MLRPRFAFDDDTSTGSLIRGSSAVTSSSRITRAVCRTRFDGEWCKLVTANSRKAAAENRMIPEEETINYRSIPTLTKYRITRLTFIDRVFGHCNR